MNLGNWPERGRQRERSLKKKKKKRIAFARLASLEVGCVVGPASSKLTNGGEEKKNRAKYNGQSTFFFPF